MITEFQPTTSDFSYFIYRRGWMETSRRTRMPGIALRHCVSRRDAPGSGKCRAHASGQVTTNEDELVTGLPDRHFYDRYVSTHFSSVGSASRENFEKRLLLWRSYLLPLLPSVRGSAILEVGCGTGYNLYALRSLGYHNLLGVDLSAECVAFCTEQGLPARLVDERLTSLEGSFDMVLLYDILEHFEPSAAVELLAAVNRVLSQNGRILISVPSCDYPPNLSLRYSDLTHHTLYNQMSLSQLLRVAGFEPTQYLALNALTVDDRRRSMRLLKVAYSATVARAAEGFWRLLMLAQGVSVPNCRPTLVAVAVRTGAGSPERGTVRPSTTRRLREAQQHPAP